MKILVAEDEPEILKIYNLMFEDEGYQVVSSIDGKQCLDLYTTELSKVSGNTTPFDLVLLDQRMPKMSGAEVAQKIFALQPNQRMLMVTAYPTHNELQNAELRNKMQVIQKPFDPDELIAIIGQIVAMP